MRIRRIASLRFDPDDGVMRAGHAGVGDEGGASREDARVGCLHMRVRSDDCRDSPVEPAGERDLLARRFRVDVDEDEWCLLDGLVDEVVDDLEHRGRRIEEERSQDVHHREARAVRRRDDGQSSPGHVLRHVRRANDSIRVVEVRADFCAPEGVVSESDRVRPGGEQLVGEARRDPDPVGGVLAVDDAHVDLQVCAQRGQESLERGPARTPTTSAMKRMRRAGTLESET